MASAPSIPTAPKELSVARLRRGHLLRRAGLTLLILFVGAGLFNVFGTRSARVSKTEGDLSLTVFYPDRTRPALPIRWKVDLESATGFSKPIQLAVNLSYFDYFDFNNFYPAPDTTENRGDLVVFTFAPPTTNTLNVLFDGRTQPGRAGIADAVTSVLDDDGSELMHVNYTTEVFP